MSFERGSVMLTGASGFIGRFVERALRARGYRVLPVEFDLFDEGARREWLARHRPDHVLHLAWYTEHGKFWSAPVNADWVRMGREFFADFRRVARSGHSRFVAAGTVAEYDWGSIQSRPLTESAPLRPGNFYGQCKHELREALVGDARDSGVTVVWGRVFWLYGPGENPARLVAHAFARTLQGLPAEFTAGTQVRDFIHVSDLGEAFSALLDSDVSGAVNLASGVAVSLREVLEEIGRVTGRPELLHIGAKPVPAQDPPYLVADVTRMREELKVHPRFRLAEGLRETWQWWQTQAGAHV
ncbi:MAG: NAD-dependent epimerase/dehydratase family protein [Bacteriovoracia bacterium]